MAQSLILKNKGLFTNSNQLSEVPEGALSLAKNIVIDKDGVVEPCRGFGRLPFPTASSLDRFDRATVFQNYLIGHKSNDNQMAYYDESAGWTAYPGSYSHPNSDFARMQFSPSNGNLYFTTSTGIKVLESVAGPVYNTGMPRGLDGVATTTGTSGMMATNTQVAYRIIWGAKDINNNLYLGTPSQRITVANTSGGSRDVSITFTVPDGISTDDFFQVYRSKESATSNDEANDELQLVYEKNPTAGEITARQVTFVDSTPTSLMGASLYSNASQEGIQESNDEPPLAKDICVFKNYTFFLNVQTKHRLSVKLLSVGGTGLALDQTITIDGLVYTAKASENVALGQFKLSSGGSAAQNISDTAQSLVKVINQRTANTSIYAYYLSGYQDLPGQISLVARVLGSSAFVATRSNTVAFDIGTGTSSNDSYANGLMWSKKQQPEHVPTAHLEFIGSKNFEGRRILALRDSLFILKDDGVYRLTGTGGSWSIDPLDTSTKIIAPDSAVVVNNQIFALCDQGIVTISDIGVQVISRPIEDQIQGLVSANYENLKKLSFGVAYETDRKYYLWTISSSNDVYPTQAFVYNTFTQAWTTRVKDAKHAVVNLNDDRMLICNPTDKYLLKERKSLTFRDFVDEEVDGFEVVSSSDLSVVLNTTVGLDVGYLLYSSDNVYSVIRSVDSVTNTVVVNDVKAWPVGAVTVNKVIDCEIEYAAQHFDNPGVMKHFQETALLLREAGFIIGDLSFFTDLSGGYSATPVNGTFGTSLWGVFDWGSGTWGGVTRPKPIRVFVPREKSRGTLLSIKFSVANAFAKWSLNGISIHFDWVSERTGRS